MTKPARLAVATAILATWGASSCISKGDTNIEGNSDDNGPNGGSLCAQMCNKIKDEGCNLNPNCAVNCTRNAQTCLDAGDHAFDTFLECAIQNPMMCGSTGEFNVPACTDEWEAAALCAYGGVCAQPGEACETTADCCDDSTCTNFPEYGGALCAGNCQAAGDCESGCCASLEGGGAVCAPAEYCEEPALAEVGVLCSQSSECASGYCEIWWDTPPGYCSADCSVDADCGTLDGVSNICVDGTCSPGCSTDSDCTGIADGTLGCFYVDDPAATFCFPPD